MAGLTYSNNKAQQFIYCFVLVVAVTGCCLFFMQDMDYRMVAFLLLLTVSVTAVLFAILPVLLTAAASALAWNYFFIPPHFTLHITNATDLSLFLMYFVIALVNAVLTYKIRRAQKAALAKEEKANTIKLYNTLLNSLSHELRTPIATIIGATDNLQNFSSRLTPINRNELIHEISKASFRLNQQVENLLNMSRVESGFIKPKKDWCDVVELIYETVKHVEDNTGYTTINIQANPAIPLCKIDKGMMEQVLYNLLYNAVVHAKAANLITIIAACHADVLEIIVEDDGPGFPKAEIGQVFDKFYRLQNTAAGGTGLGLSIVKGFVEAHKGSVSLQNKATGGARFTVQIPAETSYINNLKNE